MSACVRARAHASVLITIAHMMPTGCHGCGDFLCTFHQYLSLEQIQLFCSSLDAATRSQTLTEYIWNVFLCMHASVFNPVNRKVLFSRCCYESQSVLCGYFFEGDDI